jgi:hypothetical protein
LSTPGSRRTLQGHRPLPSWLDAGRAGAGPTGSFRRHSSTIPPLRAIRMWDRMVFGQSDTEQKDARGPRSGMWLCRLAVEESAEAAPVASGPREYDRSTLAILGRRPVPESAAVGRESCQGSTIRPRVWSQAWSWLALYVVARLLQVPLEIYTPGSATTRCAVALVISLTAIAAILALTVHDINSIGRAF